MTLDAGARESEQDRQIGDWLRAGVASDEIVTRLTEVGMPEVEAEIAASRAVRMVIEPEAIRLLEQGISSLRVQDELIEKGFPRRDVFAVVDQALGLHTVAQLIVKSNAEFQREEVPRPHEPASRLLLPFGLGLMNVGLVFLGLGWWKDSAALLGMGGFVLGVGGFVLRWSRIAG